MRRMSRSRTRRTAAVPTPQIVSDVRHPDVLLLLLVQSTGLGERAAVAVLAVPCPAVAAVLGGVVCAVLGLA